MSKLSIILSEDQEAANLAEWLFWQQHLGTVELYSHIPHETYTTSWRAKRKNKVLGVNPGVPDYVIITPTAVLFVELKRVKNSTTSIEQEEWVKRLSGKVTDATVAKGFEEAKRFIEKYLSPRK